MVILTYIFCLKWNNVIVTYCFDCLIIQFDGCIYILFLFKRHSSNICMPIEKLLFTSDFVILLIEFLIWISTEIALAHKLIHYMELLYLILKKTKCTINYIFIIQSTLYSYFVETWAQFWVLCKLHVRTWYKIQSNASTKIADRTLQHPFLLSYRLTVANQYFSSNVQFLIQSHLSLKKQPSSLETRQIWLWAPLQLRSCEIMTLLTNPEIQLSPQRWISNQLQ